MWRCSHCGESVEDSFDLCWNCGAVRAGNEANIPPESDTPSIPDSDEYAQSESAADAMPEPSTGRAMNRREIAALICKTLALLMFAQAAFLSITGAVLLIFMAITAPFRPWFDWHEFFVTVILSIPMFASLIVGAIYWKKSESMASRMVPADPAPVTHASITIQDIMMVAFSTAGVFILVDGVRDFVGIVYLAHEYSFTASEFWNNTETWTASVQMGLALWLMLGSRGIVNAIHWLRTAGIPNGEDEPDLENAG